MNNLGKLVKSLGGKCPECLQASLQLRLKILENNSEQEYTYCSSCGYEKKIGYKEKGRRHGDKKRLRSEKTDGKTGW